MQPIQFLLLAGLATVAVGGFAGLAHAGDPGVKTLTIQLPGGGVEQISYTGDVAPQVVLAPPGAVDAVAAPMPPALMPVALPFGPSDPFAALEQISATMDQQAAAMINAVNEMAAGAPLPGALLPGANGYSFISSLSGGLGGGCMRSVEITMGAGQAPQVVSHSFGQCGAAPGMNAGPAAPAGAVPAALPAAPVPVQQPHLIRVRDLLPTATSHASQT